MQQDPRQRVLSIRPEQLKALSSVPEQAFADALYDFARDNLALWVRSLSPDVLRNRITSGVERARSHGFEWQSSIAAFVALMLRFSPNFDEYPPIRALLDENGAEREERAERLFTEITPEQWLAVEERYGPYAWYEFGAGTMQ